MHVENLEGDRVYELLPDPVFVAMAECVAVNFVTKQQGHAFGEVRNSVYKREQCTTVKSCLISSFPCIFDQIIQHIHGYLIGAMMLVDIAFDGASHIQFVLPML